MLATLLWGGVLADRYSRRLLMIGSDLARAAVMPVFFALDASGHLGLTHDPRARARSSARPTASSSRRSAASCRSSSSTPMLASANSWIGIARQGSAIVGPAIAATLYGTTGPSSCGRSRLRSFLVSAGALWLARPRAIEPTRSSGMRKELAEGFRYVFSVPWIWTGIGAATVILMLAMAPYTALLPRIVQSHYHRGVGSYGAPLQRDGRGHGRRLARVGALAPAARPRRDLLRRVRDQRPRHRRARAVAVVPARGRARRSGAGSGSGSASPSWMTLISELVPEHLLSRVLSFDYFGSFGLTPVGFVLAGVVATAIAPTTILAVGGALGCLALVRAAARGARSGSPRDAIPSESSATRGRSPSSARRLRPDRESHGVMRYLLRHGLPLHPRPARLRRRCSAFRVVPTLLEIDEPIDLVDVFRRAGVLRGATRAKRSRPARRRSGCSSASSRAEARAIARGVGGLDLRRERVHLPPARAAATTKVEGRAAWGPPVLHRGAEI